MTARLGLRGTGWSGRTALVSGGSRGIGLGIARELAAVGVRVAIASRSNASLRAATEAIESLGGGEVLAVRADFGIEKEVHRAVARTREQFGRLDILVNNAGAAAIGPFLELSTDAWVDAFQVKVFGAVFASRAALPIMIEQQSGSILNIVGNSAVRSLPLQSASGSTCAALLYLTRALAAEYAGRGIRINALSPGPTATSRWDSVVESISRLDGERTPTQVQADIDRAVPRGHIGQPVEIARAALFLLSDDASFVNGAHLLADGGMTVA